MRSPNSRFQIQDSKYSKFKIFGFIAANLPQRSKFWPSAIPAPHQIPHRSSSTSQQFRIAAVPPRSSSASELPQPRGVQAARQSAAPIRHHSKPRHHSKFRTTANSARQQLVTSAFFGSIFASIIGVLNLESGIRRTWNSSPVSFPSVAALSFVASFGGRFVRCSLPSVVASCVAGSHHMSLATRSSYSSRLLISSALPVSRIITAAGSGRPLYGNIWASE